MADYLLGGALLATSIVVASRPTAADGDHPLTQDRAVGSNGFWMLPVVAAGTVVSMPFLLGAVISRERMHSCVEQNGKGPLEPSYTPAEYDVPVSDVAAPPADADPNATPPERFAPATAPATPAPATAPGSPPTPAFTGAWTDAFDDREIAEKLARSAVQARAHEECRKLDGATLVIDQLRYGSLECEKTDSPATWRCRYRDAVAICEVPR